ncbi:MAG: hypothetical protein CMP84_00150 [Gammaproteobacteria bacterium]|nr:hypothetical protein [Gammaproteobacteria bacterium]
MLFFIPVYFYSDALNLLQVLLPSSMLFALFSAKPGTTAAFIQISPLTLIKSHKGLIACSQPPGAIKRLRIRPPIPPVTGYLNPKIIHNAIRQLHRLLPGLRDPYF